ncbi:MAG: TonB-dependent receptor [Candidatus Thioglobus sp.]|jgi:vitamin B12 transporter|nr:TonB-dependent receptor [Candidatus Thioglobus sp.]
MIIKNILATILVLTIQIPNTANALIGPIKISLNTEYRTSAPIIGPVATTIKLSKSDIKRTGKRTFTGLLESIHAVSFEGGQGNLTALRIRGNESSHTLLLLDGNKVTITGGQPNLDVIPLDQIERIEITKGPFSSLYGPGAIGGIIHVFTDKDVNSISRNRIDISYGSNDTNKINLNSYFKSDTGYMDIALTDFHTDGIDATGDGDLDPIDRTTVGINIGTEVSDKTSVNLNIMNTKAIIEYDDTWGTPKPDNNLRQFNVGVSHKFSDRFATKFDYMNQNTQRRGDKYKLNTVSLINELDFDYSKLSVGLSNSVDKDIANSKNIKHSDLFSQWQGLIIDNELSIGARIVDHDKFSTHYTYNFNWAKDLSSSLRVNGSYGSATNLPDHYKNNLNITQGQTDLKPERSKNFELGLIKEYGWGTTGVKLYKSKVSDAFTYLDPDSNWLTDNAYYRNDGTVDIKGAELTLDTELLGWQLDVNIDFNQAINKSTNLQKGRRPNRSIGVNLSKTSGKWKRSVNWSAKSWVWDKDNHSNGKLGGYGLLSLSTSYDFNEDLSVFLNINNALDKDYEMAQGYNTLGRNINLGISHTF